METINPIEQHNIGKELVALVEVTNAKQVGVFGQNTYVWTTYEIQVNGNYICGGALNDYMWQEFDRQLNFSRQRAKGL